MDSKIFLRELTISDISQIAAVHSDSFSDSALTKLGARVVERYYAWLLTGPHDNVRAVGAFMGADCAGFSFGGVFSGSTSGFVRFNKALLIKEVLRHPRNLFTPQFLRRILIGIKLLRGHKKTGNPKPKKKIATSFGILSIAVSRKYQNHGIGQLLLEDAERTAVKAGFAQMDLSVHPDNFQAIRFYEKHEWEKIPTNAPWRGVMIKKLGSANKPAENFQSQTIVRDEVSAVSTV